MLTEIQIENIKSAEKIIFSTSDKNNQPRSIWVVPSRIEKIGSFFLIFKWIKAVKIYKKILNVL